MKSRISVSVIGLGYIGLPTAVFMAKSGIRVFGYDISERVRLAVSDGRAHIFEEGLDELVQLVVNSGNLTIHDALQPANVYMICVPTPVSEGLPDLQFVQEATRHVAAQVKNGDVVILESTSPVGTVESIQNKLSELAPDVSVKVAYCPERVIPGRMLEEFRTNPRIIGCDCKETASNLAAFYAGFTAAEVTITDAKTAEMCKLVENAYRDVNLAFANEVSLLADASGVDVWELRRLANLHPRVNML
ncbi:nucleotide sugar dehydrogenase [Luminiphilus sp.]|nr:nucleotide sugar dehydrogenase [Luminiphilus sp.]